MHPVKQPGLTRKFPLTDMPTGLMAALVTRLADPPDSPGRSTSSPFSNFAPTLTRTTRWGCVNRAPVGPGGFDELEGHRYAGGAEAGSHGDPECETRRWRRAIEKGLSP
jgi:hypothetical protein